ncbi:MAG: hypothetical protein VYA80_03245 [Pseudomonadota bacterium]|nr:hypothetical protein [Pseudomonadota bacterium]
MQNLLRLPRANLLFSLMAVGGVILFIFAIAVLMAEPSQIMGGRPASLTCLQVAFTPERMMPIILSFPENIREAIADILIPGDMVLAWGYGFLLAGLTGLLAMRLPGKWFKIGSIIMWTPLFASTLDCIEDIFLHSAIMSVINNPAAEIPLFISLFAGITATIKYLFITVVTPGFCLLGIIKGISFDRRFTSIILYLIISVVMISFTGQAFQELPPCL